MISVDTTFFLALVIDRDVLHSRAAAWSGHAKDEKKITTEYVIWEVVNTMSLVSRRARAVAFVRQLPHVPDLHLEWASNALFQEGMDLFASRPDKEWSLTDCTSFVVMQRHGLTQALTYDHHFEQAGFEALLRREPT